MTSKVDMDSELHANPAGIHQDVQGVSQSSQLPGEVVKHGESSTDNARKDQDASRASTERVTKLSLDTAVNAFPPPDGNCTSPVRPLPDHSSHMYAQEWPLKSIRWPPFSDRQTEVKILIQDANGPCSFLSIVNILLLRGDIHLPTDSQTASYADVSARVADFLLQSGSVSPPSSPTYNVNSLDFALNILPTTLKGLDVNVNFVDGGFAAAEGTEQGALDLFKLANVSIRHGWVASTDDKEIWSVLHDAAPDYDTAVVRLAEGDELAAGTITASSAGPASPDIQRTFEDLSINPERQAKVYQAAIIQRFLASSSSQLTYAGLFSLSESLPAGTLCALFRNSHFSVLYRRPDELPPNLTQQAAFALPSLPQATLFHLVTDHALLHESTTVWESLEDVDGAASRFYDSDLRPAQIRQDWVAREYRNPTAAEEAHRRNDAEYGHPLIELSLGSADVMNSMALAAQLQQDEYDQEERHRQAEHHGRQAQEQTSITLDQAVNPGNGNAKAASSKLQPVGRARPRPTDKTKVKKDKDCVIC